jgi:hypothetical protein
LNNCSFRSAILRSMCLGAVLTLDVISRNIRVRFIVNVLKVFVIGFDSRDNGPVREHEMVLDR